MPSHPQRIFVTGMGAVTPLGFSVAETWRGLLAGTSAITPLDLFDLGGISCTQAGQIRNFTPPAVITAAGACNRATGFAAAACIEALAQSQRSNLKSQLSNSPVALVTATNFVAMDHGENALMGTGTSCRAPP